LQLDPFLVRLLVAIPLFSAVASTFVMLLGARLLMGLAEGPVIPIQQAIVMAESSPRRRGLNMGIVQNLGSQGIGSLLGPLIIIQLALLLGWRAAFLVAGVPALIIAILMAWYVREPVRIKDVRLPDSTSGGATKLFAPFRFRNVCLCAIIGSASAAWYYLLLTFLPIWLVRELGMTETDMSIVVSAIGLAGVVWSIVMPWLSDRFGRQRIMILAAACGALAPLVALLSGPNIVVLVIFTFLGGTTIALFPLSCIVPLETVPAREAATTTAIIVAMSTIMGGGIGPIVGGMLADSFGLQITLIAALAMIFVAVGAALGLQETAPASLEMTA
jgi:predicted MFS family arabinose efflux permease